MTPFSRMAGYIVYWDTDGLYWWRKRWYGRAVGSFIGPYRTSEAAHKAGLKMAKDIRVEFAKPRDGEEW